MNTVFKELLDSTILQSVLAIMIWGVICYMYATGQNVPDALLAAGSVVLGFYFHSGALQTYKKVS